MSVKLSNLLNAVTVPGIGLPLVFNDERYQGGSHSIEVSGVFVGSVDIEARTNVNWVTVATVTTIGLISVTGTYTALRANVTSLTSGSITTTVRYPLLQDINTDIKTLVSRISATRANLLDNLNRLDVSVSSISSKTPLTNLTKLLRQYGKL